MTEALASEERDHSNQCPQGMSRREFIKLAAVVGLQSDERIAVKVNTIFSGDCTHIPLVMAVAECLQEVGVPAEQIIVFDRRNFELEGAGYLVNRDGPGVRCEGTDGNYTAGWTIADTNIRLSDILLDCDALINIPILTGVVFAGMGITFTMKIHFGTFDRPSDFHGGSFERGVTELNALPPIKDRTRLIIGDILTTSTYRSHFGRYVIEGDSILMSFDPVAHDTISMKIAAEAYGAEGLDSTAVMAQATPWLGSATKLGLGGKNLLGTILNPNRMHRNLPQVDPVVHKAKGV
jgi:hypothetical protein